MNGKFVTCRNAGADIVRPIQSARLNSNFAFKYGKAEIRAKLPRGDWIWPGKCYLIKCTVQISELI